MSKYISILQIRESISRLSSFHIFFGTTFLVLKKNEVPVGSSAYLSLDAENRHHLQQYFRVNPKSDFFFTPFQTKRNEGRWRDPKYASTSLQAINTQGFAEALLHTKKEKDWGWSKDYLQFLRRKLPKGRRIPLLHLAVWFGRDEPWNDSATRQTVVDTFVKQYLLTQDEIDSLFDTGIDSSIAEDQAFQVAPPNTERIIEGFGAPPDVPIEGGATLQYLEFSGIGPTRRLEFRPSPRLNVVTGDNGLGKTFLLDVIWWALTREWADRMLVPLQPVATPPSIKFLVHTSPDHRPVDATFDAKSQRWKVQAATATSGLVIYARVDGSFAVWDPANRSLTNRAVSQHSTCVMFTREEIWFGDRNSKIEGLLRDWVRWQTRAGEFPAFETFKNVVEHLKPPDAEGMAIGMPTRIPGMSMEVPCLVHSYGQVPIVFESAGIRRVLTLAYLIVWAWYEHKIQAKQSGQREERQMVILLDEAEAHLHPRWQRVLLPSLLGIAGDLHTELSIQYFVASHSPLVLASAEPVWDPERDSLFHLRASANGRVLFDRVPFEIRGTSDSWLQSPSFDGLHPGSAPAEAALRQAKALMEKSSVLKADVEAVSTKLAEHIPADDAFWLRWIMFAKQHDVNI